MKRIILCGVVMLLTVIVQAQQRQISYIETTHAWYYIYDEQGKRVKAMSVTGIGELKGWGNDFFVTRNGGFYYIYSMYGKVLKTLGAQSVGEVVAVSGNTFVSRVGSWLSTWNKEGQKISTRSAR